MVSTNGLAGAALLLVAGLAQFVLFQRGLAKSREGLPPAEAAEKAKMHGAVLRMLFAIDLLALPIAGYFLGTAIFD